MSFMVKPPQSLFVRFRVLPFLVAPAEVAEIGDTRPRLYSILLRGGRYGRQVAASAVVADSIRCESL